MRAGEIDRLMRTQHRHVEATIDVHFGCVHVELIERVGVIVGLPENEEFRRALTTQLEVLEPPRITVIGSNGWSVNEIGFVRLRRPRSPAEYSARTNAANLDLGSTADSCLFLGFSRAKTASWFVWPSQSTLLGAGFPLETKSIGFGASSRVLVPPSEDSTVFSWSGQFLQEGDEVPLSSIMDPGDRSLLPVTCPCQREDSTCPGPRCLPWISLTR